MPHSRSSVRVSRSSLTLDVIVSTMLVFLFIPMVLIQASKVSKALRSRQEEDIFESSLRVLYCLLLSTAATAMIWRARLLYCGSISCHAKADGALAISMMLPFVSSLNSALFPSFIDGKSWPMYAGATQFVSASLLDLPPTHQALASFIQCSVYSALDYIQSQAGKRTCLLGYDLVWSIACHFGLRTLPLYLVSFASSLITILIFLKQRRNVARFLDGKVDLSRLAFQPPFASFGMGACFWDYRFFSVLKLALAWMDATAHQLSDSIDEAKLAACFYGGLALLFTVYLFIMRMLNPKSLIPPEFVFCGLLANFMMGRLMSRLDVAPAFDFLKSKISISSEVMADLLPDFVVDQIMSRDPFDVNSEDPCQNSPENNIVSLHSSSQGDLVVFPPALGSSENASLGHFVSDDFLLQSRAPSRLTSGRCQRLDFQRHDEVTIFFSDLVGFSTWSHHSNPEHVITTLDNLFSRLDTIIMKELKGLAYKIETIGDAYVVAINLVHEDKAHALTAVKFALRAQEEANKVYVPGTKTPLQMRVGIHTGPVVAGIVGKMRKRWSCFGMTMDVAAKTEASCPPGQVQLTEATYKCLLAQSSEDKRRGIQFVDRELVRVKGSEELIHMYLASNL